MSELPESRALPAEAAADTLARMAAVLAAMPDLWFVFDALGRYRECSHPGHPWLVRPYDQMRGRSMSEVLDADLAQRGMDAIRAALHSGQMQRFEYEMQCRDSVTRHFEARLTPFGADQVLYLIRDLTDLRHLERELLLMHRALEADASVPLAICDALKPDFPTVYVNRAFERLTGWPRDEVLGRNLRLLQCDATENDGRTRIRRALAAGLGCSVALTNRRRDGSTFVNQMQLAPVLDDAGRATHYIGVLEDATQRLHTAQQLQYSEELYRSLALAISDGLVVINAHGAIVTANPAACALLGVPFDSLIGGGLSRHGLRLVHEDGQPLRDDENPVRQVLAGARSRGDQVFRLQGPGAEVRQLSLNVQPLHRVSDGRTVSCVVTFRDITQLRVAEHALRDKQAAELANRAKSDFLSRVSHEMRTPLNAVIGFAQLLKLGASSGDAALRGEYTEHILRAGEHLLALINELLDLQRAEKGEIELRLAAVAVEPALRETIDLLRPLALEREVRCLLPERADAWVQADAQRLRQVLMNVVSNAVKYNRRGGRVDLSWAPAGPQSLAIEVRDTGAGLSAAELAQLFQPFERLGHAASSIEGSGLGLVIARSLTEEMGGRLVLSSTPGQGSCVRIELPLAPAPPTPDTPPPAPAAAVVAAATAAPSMRLLYVEDNRINAMLFDEAIKLDGRIELRVAEDGTEAIALVADWRPEVLVLDAHLPDMDGFDLLERLRRSPGLASVPAFMCSADAMPEDLERARHAGFAGYWVKPIDIAAVLRDLQALPRP